MLDFDLKKLLDYLEDDIEREMLSNIRFDGFVIKRGDRDDGGQQRSAVVADDSPPDPSASGDDVVNGTRCDIGQAYGIRLRIDNVVKIGSGGQLGHEAGGDRRRQDDHVQRASSVFDADKKSKPIEIVNPATGEKVQF